MNEPKPLPPLIDEQDRASRPHAHVWLSASAGTGKTHVLSSRVLRLLLSGVAPERILCLTFTKAGAAEMAERVHGTLARWVQIDEGGLFKDLEALGEASGPEARARARLLFARVLDATGGGLKIQTIHSFCQSLLAAFPLEAGLVPGFRPLDDRQQAELSRSALIAMIEAAERGHDYKLLAAIEALALRLGEQGAISYLGKCVGAEAAFTRLDEYERLGIDIETALLRGLDLPTDDVLEHIAGQCTDADIPDGELRRLLAANRDWGTVTADKVACQIEQWLDADLGDRAHMVEALCKALVTGKGEPDGRYIKQWLQRMPDYADVARDIGGRLRALCDLPAHVAFVRGAAQALHAGRAFARAYAGAKRLAGVVDFDDLIGRASQLLTTKGIAEWIRYKLDQRIDHMLVDEAQDTNERQWALVEAIVEEYFEAEPDGERGARRTLFVVGDTKQAIFGFQGTSPQAFVNALRRFQGRAVRTGHEIDELPLALSFRSMPAVLDVVDATLAEIGHEAVGLAAMPAHHRAARAHPGQVLLLPPTSLRKIDEEDGPPDFDDEITGDEDWHDDHVRAHADRIARQVKSWIDQKLFLRSKGRTITPGDILILLRSRGALSRLIVARLYDAKVPVAGVDRLRLQAPLAVQDLLAALRFAVQPEDDLNLACLLVSPLIGWTQEHLLERAVPRQGSLWSHLRATLGEEIAPLRALLASADLVTPYRYLEAILSGPLDGRRKLTARLGEEAFDAIDELLNAALGFEMDDHPSLQRFIDWFDRGDADIKRELAEGSGMVRVMTVHGSKGLEAPLVILADAAHNPDRLRRTELLELSFEDKILPMIRPSKTDACPALAEAMEAADAAEMEEHWRLLYVGMTRAEEMLVVAGVLPPSAKGEMPEASWHRRVGQAMEALGANRETIAPWGEALIWSGPQGLPDAEPPKAAAAQDERALETPDWLRNPAPVEARPPRPLAPSAAPEDDVPHPPPDAAMRTAARRGSLLHALFERLPDVALAERRGAAERWLAGAGQVSDALLRAEIVDHAMKVIEDPAHAALFSSDALAEAPIAAVVEGQVIAGTVDRLLVTESMVHVVDFKTGRAVPAGAEAVPVSHLRQMAAYAQALAVIFPGRTIRASLLYSSGPALIDLPEALLAAHKPGFATAQQNLFPGSLEGEGAAH